MTYKKPSLNDLIKIIESDFYSRFNNDTKPSLHSIIKVLSRVLAGAAYMMYSNIEWATHQIFPDKSDEFYFSKWANLYNVKRKKPNYALGTVIIRGVNKAKIPAYTKMQTENGIVFQTVKEEEINNEFVEAEIHAMQSGLSGNLKAFTFLTLVNPISGIDSKAQLGANGTFNGTDVEDLESWRRRFFLRLKTSPCAGNQNDYEAWALEISGVTRAWCYPCFPKKGVVGLTCVKDNDPDIIPNKYELEIFKQIILEKMPITAELNLFQLIPLYIDFEIQLRNNNESNRKKIKNILKNIILENGAPNKTIKLYQFIISIQLNDFSLDDFNIITPIKDIKASNLQIHILGNITYKELV